MLTLDCESRASALASVSTIYRVAQENIDAFLRSFDLTKHYERFDPPCPGDQEFRRMFESELECRPLQPDRVCWFHLTRARQGETFAEGLQPLTLSIDRIWATVLAAFRGTAHESRLNALRVSGVPGFHYQAKVGVPLHAGPYAMLVRDVARRANEIGSHDYLWLPEIMEDICNGYSERYGEYLHDQLAETLRPTVVKFWSTKRRGDDCVESALYYLYLTAQNKRLTLYANTCFDGENDSVPSEQILGVEQPAA